MKTKLFLSVGLFCFLAACSPKTTAPISTFSAAVVDVTASSGKAYLLLNEAAIEQRIVETAADLESNPNLSTFKPVLDKELALRMELLNGLNAYAAALLSLSTTNYREDIDKASKNLYGAMTSINASYGKIAGQSPFDGKSLAIAGTAVDLIGSALVEKKRRAAIKAIIISSNDGVQKACQLLEKDLIQSGYSGLIKGYLTTVSADYISAYKKQKKAISFEERVTFIREIQKTIKAADGVDDLFNKIGLSIGNVAKGHQALKETLEKNEVTTPALVEQIGEIAKYGKSIHEFYKALIKE